MTSKHRRFKITDDACFLIYAATWVLAGALVCAVYWTGRDEPHPPIPPWSQESYADFAPYPMVGE